MSMNSIPRGRVVRFGLFELDLIARELRKSGLRIKLHGQPFEVLVMLLEHPGEVVTREELQQRLWSSDIFVDFDHGVNAAINRLREALGDSAESPRFIETLPRRGYRFIAAIEATPLTPLGGVASTEANRTDAAMRVAPKAHPRSVWMAMLALASLFAILVGLNIGGLRDQIFAKHSTPQVRSIAVLPLLNLSNDAEQDYFADGMTDQLTTDLGKISALRVISRTSTARYKGTKKPMNEIGQELGVDVVVEGTVTRAGNHIRITANLVQTSPEKHLWAESYESELGDILSLQNELAESIAAVVRIKLTPQEQQRLGGGTRPVKPEAYEDYLKGQYFFNKFTPEDNQKALAYFQKAVQEDPNLVSAYVGISNAYQILGNIEIMLPNVAHPLGKQAIAKALEIDPNSGDAHGGLAWRLLYYDWDFAASEKEFKLALELDPNSPLVHQGYSKYFASLGKFPESITEMKRALDLDPLSLNKLSDYCRVLYYARRYEEALAQCKAALELDPNYPEALDQAGDVYSAMRDEVEAHRMYRKAAMLFGEDPAVIAAGEKVFEKSGTRGFEVWWLDQFREYLESGEIVPMMPAGIYTDLGEKDQAFACLKKGYERRSHYMIFLGVEPGFDPLRSDPRFVDLLHRIGLPQAKQNN